MGMSSRPSSALHGFGLVSRFYERFADQAVSVVKRLDQPRLGLTY
ncbi:hypothetical protein [Kutzneria buriramensis]|nr:hypothetical protein [Kutzneria buriramensis]